MAMVPRERSLVKRMQEQKQPFALIGVNLDSSREELKRVERDKEITWRSFFDGRRGPISRQWRVEGIPTIHVIDHKGVIRFIDISGEQMDKAVETLLQEMESAK